MVANGSVTLERLAEVTAGQILGDASYRVADVVHDSAVAGHGSLFVAVRGMHRDGHDFARAAAEAGAAVCVDHELAVPIQIVVADTRSALGLLAAEVHGRPSERCRVVGVTGTNGKTMVTHFLEAIVAASGGPPGLIGTLGARIDGVPIEIARTTPEASDLQRLLARMVSSGVDVVAIEVSSHALVLERAAGTHFAVAAFTNLGHDHLDFHHDMEEYFAAKSRLFTPGFADRAIVWVEDDFGARLSRSIRIPVTTVGWADADIIATGIEGDLSGSDFTLVRGHEATPAHIDIGGRFNVANAAVAAACGFDLGLAADDIVEGLARVERVPGRFEVVDVKQPFTVVVDYAHTPDGVRSAIETARRAGQGKVIAVVGSAGDRDALKRPEMGAAASAADFAFLTSDNPRSEDPESILAEVVTGASGDWVVGEVDRRIAIRRAMYQADPGDIVLILGKGHETHQEVDGRMLPFDDREVAREEAS